MNPLKTPTHLLALSLALCTAGLIGCESTQKADSHGDGHGHEPALAQGESCSCACTCGDDDQKKAKDQGEESYVAIADLPAAVTDAAQKAFPNGTLREAEREIENGRAVYEIEISDAGKKHEMEITADGAVLEIEAYDDDDDDA